MAWLSCASRDCGGDDASESSAAPRLSAPLRAYVYLAGRFGVKSLCRDGGAACRRRSQIQLATVAALLLLALLTIQTPVHQVAPFNGTRITVTRVERRGNFRRTRVPYDSKNCATYPSCRLLIRYGDVEPNPGPTQHTPRDASRTQTAQHRAQRPGVLLASLQHARSLKSKLGDLRAATPELNKFDLIAITETWLNDTVQDSELSAGLPDHTWFRRGRGSLGGGVACAVRSQLQPTRLPDPPGSELLLVRLGALSVTVAVCYRPPDDDASLTRLTAAIDSLPGCDRLVLAGDINLPEVQWHPRDDSSATPAVQRGTDRACRFLDDCNLLGLKQWVNQPTRGPNTLDLVFTRGLACSAAPREGWLNSDHHEVVASIVMPNEKPPIVTRSTVFNYKRADFPGLRRALSLAPWCMLDGLEMNHAVDVFYSLLEAAICDHVPRVTLRRLLPPWFDSAARQALRSKETAFRRLRRNPSDETEKRSAFKSICERRYSSYLRDIVDAFRSNPKRYWTFLKYLPKRALYTRF